MAVGEQLSDGVGADIARPPGDQDVHGHTFFLRRYGGRSTGRSLSKMAEHTMLSRRSMIVDVVRGVNPTATAACGFTRAASIP